LELENPGFLVPGLPMSAKPEHERNRYSKLKTARARKKYLLYTITIIISSEI
jgi:hypothetical protein